MSESDLKAKYSFLDDLSDNAKDIAKSKFTMYEYLESIGADESIIKIRINIVFLLLKPIGKLF